MPAESFRVYQEELRLAGDALFQGASAQSALLREKLAHEGPKMKYVLPMVSCEAVCGDHRPAVAASLVYQLGYASSLIIDDIFDRGERRRNVPTMHEAYGSEAAILTSLVYVFEMFRGISGMSGLEEGSTSRMVSKFAEAGISACESEAMKKQACSRPGSVDMRHYLSISERGTGKMFGAASFSGAVCGKACRSEEAALESFGSNLGVAYQIGDDIYDIFGDPSRGGKPIFSNMKNSQPNALLIDALEHSDGRQRETLLSMMGRPKYKPYEVKLVQDLVTDLGSVGRVGGMIRRFVEKNGEVLEKSSVEGNRLMEFQEVIVRPDP
jgi:geranylgeranyl diphosphate synthase type II